MKVYLLIGLVLLVSRLTWAGGDNVGNGGDPCEQKFQSIRDDIESWINLGGATDLKLPESLSQATFKNQMLTQIRMAKINCTEETVKVGQVEKTCRNFFDLNNVPIILCNRNRFLTSSVDDQYVLVHHEFAGLSGFEMNAGEASDYRISSQITSYLANQIVKKLVVKIKDPHRLQLYDLSILLPKISGPESKSSYALKPSDIGGYGILLPEKFVNPLEPRRLGYDQLRQIFGSENSHISQTSLNFLENLGSFWIFNPYKKSEAIALRIVPCSENLKALDPQCQHQIRVVWQLPPWINVLSAFSSSNQEASFHATYVISEDDLKAMIQKLKKLKFSVDAPEAPDILWVNPYLEQRRLGSPYAKELFEIFKTYLGEQKLVQVTLSRFGWGPYIEQGNWYFSGLNIISGKPQMISIPRINKELQSFASTRSEPGSFWGLMNPVPAELAPFNLTWREDDDIEKMSEDQLIQGGLAALKMQNVNFHNGKNTDCVSCHAAQATRQWFKEKVAWINLTKKFPQYEYQNPDFNLENKTPWLGNANGLAPSLRQFGYVGPNPIISQRVINETADALEFINKSKW